MCFLGIDAHNLQKDARAEGLRPQTYERKRRIFADIGGDKGGI